MFIVDYRYHVDVIKLIYIHCTFVDVTPVYFLKDIYWIGNRRDWKNRFSDLNGTMPKAVWECIQVRIKRNDLVMMQSSSIHFHYYWRRIYCCHRLVTTGLRGILHLRLWICSGLITEKYSGLIAGQVIMKMYVLARHRPLQISKMEIGSFFR